MNSRMIIATSPELRTTARRLLAASLAASLASCGAPSARELDSVQIALESSEAPSELEAQPLDEVLSPATNLLESEKFVLSAPEWFAVQRYVKNSLALPTSEASMRSVLQLTASDDYADFSPLQAEFSEIHGHALDWETRIYPETVDLAGDLINYAETASYLYGPLQEVIDILKNRGSSADAKAQAREDLIGIVQYLGDEATYYADRTEAVETSLHTFGALLEDDHIDVGVAGTTLKNKYGAEGGVLASTIEQIEDLNVELAQANKDYEHYALVAKTTPAYAWVVPYGLFVAIGIAGVYGDMAVQTLYRVHDLQDRIAALTATQQRLVRLIQTLQLAETNAIDIAADIGAVLPLIGKLRAHWQTMSVKLNDTVRILTNDFAGKIPVVMNANLSRALDNWELVGAAASEYMQNAYIQVQH